MTTKIYTKRGDKGLTCGSERKEVTKCSANIDVFGDIDELNSYISVVLNHLKEYKSFEDMGTKGTLVTIQSKLFEISAQIYKNKDIKTNSEMFLEVEIDHFTILLPELENFIYPDGDNIRSAHIFVCRAISRRAERSLVRYITENNLNAPNMLMYLNRLSDYLFMLARFYSTTEEPWNKKGE